MGKKKLPDFETARHLYEDENKTLAEICTMYGCDLSSIGTLSAMLRGGGVEIRNRGHYRKERTPDQPKLGRPPANTYQATGQMTFGSMEYAAEPRRTPLPPADPTAKGYTMPGDNSRYIQHTMDMFHWGKVDFMNPDDVEDRVLQYFKHCYDDDMKQSVAGLALALGIDRRRLWEMGQLENQSLSIQTTPEVREVIKHAYVMLNSQMEDYMMGGKIHPVSAIFLMKNNMDYKDQSELTLTPNMPLSQPSQIVDIQKKYDMLPEE